MYSTILGKAGEFIDRGDNTYGGKYVINPSGGLISKGHPLGATGTNRLSCTSYSISCSFISIHPYKNGTLKDSEVPNLIFRLIFW